MKPHYRWSWGLNKPELVYFWFGGTKFLFKGYDIRGSGASFRVAVTH
jgi:hypothetical protein